MTRSSQRTSADARLDLATHRVAAARDVLRAAEGRTRDARAALTALTDEAQPQP